MQNSSLDRFFFGNEPAGFAAFFHVALFRLALAYPFCVLASNSLTDACDLLLILFWLLSGHWREKIQTIKSSPVLIVAMILVVVSFIGVFRYDESLLLSIKYWRGHHPFPILIILATVLTTKTQRIQMLNALSFWLLVIMLYSFCVYRFSPFEALKPFTEASIARNTIWFGMAFVVWCGLWITVPFSLRLNPYFRPLLPRTWRSAMRIVAKQSTWDYFASYFRQRRLVHVLQAIRLGLVAFCLFDESHSNM